MTEAVLTASGRPGSIFLKLPATSANLGPGFDALGLAMSFYLTIDAALAPEGRSAIEATGRDAALCGAVEGNLILDTYASVVRAAGRVPIALHLRLHNEIPLGMGCGSSAAALLAGVLLANHFGDLGMTGYEAMEEACRREGHPDNVAACWLGGMTTSAPKLPGNGREFVAASFAAPREWGLMLAIPSAGLATTKARALLPEAYAKADAVLNVQHAALIVAAFALGRGDLLRTAMTDRMHQPYRMEACPLLPLLLPLAGTPGVLGVSLSGAGPSVLVIHERAARAEVRSAIAEAAGQVELIEANTSQGTTFSVT
ncbi:homoserine kinase [Granulicella aggregans]|uniref:homoserine kinase n=1 Tax=Granulicella aggregans TaxID=474949 RepID=UPI0021E06FF7|nr:homoserine kinase [Granulicella aggregans]